MNISLRNNVRLSGRGNQPLILAHGFGCDQNMWRHVVPAFEDEFKVVLFDHVGAGNSDLTQFDSTKYASLNGYATDVLEICNELDLERGIFVGHSVSAMVGALAAIREPKRFQALVMVGPSPRYINDGDYEGGFTADQIEELLQFLDSNHLGWSAAMAPAIMGNPDRPELSEELNNSFCRTDPDIARHFARTLFTADNRSDLPKVPVDCLVLQCSDDVIAPTSVGHYVSEALPKGQLVLLDAAGHCPHLSAPQETIGAIRRYISSLNTSDAA